ncbi:hypothetical protein AVEN_252141-1 [Araneus ventricosus]|uniref:Uncharacterized protein n=1 Tax=Araneus ventricosus TaxID=182803 RepID=A0A4Y2HFH6_ARAVE|nr:hypothetical protein AVEN_252141-1 [Araneus ventricosus]
MGRYLASTFAAGDGVQLFRRVGRAQGMPVGDLRPAFSRISAVPLKTVRTFCRLSPFTWDTTKKASTNLVVPFFGLKCLETRGGH